MPICYILHRLIAACFVLGFVISQCQAQAQTNPEQFRPNILWITSEDNGQQLGCYGDTFADTPNLNSLAAKGMMYANAWSNAPVCAPARTTIISGLFPTSLGAQHMRSAVKLPAKVKLYPEMLRELGYYCSNNSKTDYNLQVDEKTLWNDSSNKAHWRNRKAGQSFFSVFNFTTTHESQLRTRPHKAIHDPAKVKVPPYHPDAPEVRQDWAQYYDKISQMDREVGKILGQLESDGLAESTIIFYFGDHGSGMPRGKRWLYESGLKVPMIVHIPERIKPLIGGSYEKGTTNQRLVSFVDLVPTVLSILGMAPPQHLQGKAFLGKFATEDPPYIYAFRDRMDERYDMSRAVRDKQYSYIRNFLPQRPQGTFLEYMFQTPTTRAWKKLFDEGKLDDAQSAFWKPKPAEELYDLAADPFQIKNLAGDAKHAETVQQMRSELHDWMVRVGDLGLLPEGEMWSRAGEAAPYDLTQNSVLFPVRDIIEVAELASNPLAGDLDKLLKHRAARDSASRYWLASGLLLRAQMDMNREECVKATRGIVNDSSPYVRSLANETLARFGNETDREPAIKSLLRTADIRSEGLFAALTALNSLDWSQPSKQQIGTSLDGIPEIVPTLHQRYKTYIPRMLERVSSIAE
jgi:arylsulfatase A-like enzyme